MKVQCPHCQTTHSAKPDASGRPAHCTKCGQTFVMAEHDPSKPNQSQKTPSLPEPELSIKWLVIGVVCIIASWPAADLSITCLPIGIATGLIMIAVGSVLYMLNKIIHHLQILNQNIVKINNQK